MMVTARGAGVPSVSGRRRVCEWGAACVLLSGLLSPVEAVVTAPFTGDDLLAGESYTISWDPIAGCSSVDIELFSGKRRVCSIATGVLDDGTYDWTVDLCGLPPSCNLRVRIGCGAERVSSGVFAISGLLLQRVTPGSRNVQLTWSRLDGDTLGANNIRLSNETPTSLRRAYGGYNVWRRVFDNRLDESLNARFTKIRNYDVQNLLADTVASAWTFALPAPRAGPVSVDIDEDTSVIQTWLAAQTFTTPPDSALDVCNVRIFEGPVRERWAATIEIRPVDAMGLPDLSGSPLASAEQTFGQLARLGGLRWRIYPFSPTTMLAPGTTYAIVLSGLLEQLNDPRGTLLTWVQTLYDVFPGGNSIVSRDDGATWEVQSDRDFAFVVSAVLGGPRGGTCLSWTGQRRGGEELRTFNDPDSIRAFGRDAEGELTQLHPTGPFDGFQLEYALTAFDRVLLPSGNVERLSPCEDTLYTASAFPLGVQPTTQARWPEVVFPQSSRRTTTPLLRDVHPVPNPYVRDANSASFPRWERPGERRIQFFNMPDGGRVRLYTLAGDLLRSLEHTADHGSTDWDLRNEAGEIVVSGVYIWMVTAPNGETKRGQLVIVR